jgi:ribosome assembly protein RRB1
MAKRGLQDGDDEMDTKAQFGQRRIGDDRDVEMGEFEDPWEDELEEDEEIIDGGEDNEEDEEDEGTIFAQRGLSDNKK